MRKLLSVLAVHSVLMITLAAYVNPCISATLTTGAADDKSAWDQNNNGVIDDPLDNLTVLKIWEFFPFSRAAMEFDISTIPTGSTVVSAVLTYSEFVDQQLVNFVHVFGYDGDGVVGLADMGLIGTDLGAVSNGVHNSTVNVNVTAFVQSLVAGAHDYVGFTFRYSPEAISGPDYWINSSEVTNLSLRPRLSIEYAVPEPSTYVIAAMGIVALLLARRRKR